MTTTKAEMQAIAQKVEKLADDIGALGQEAEAIADELTEAAADFPENGGGIDPNPEPPNPEPPEPEPDDDIDLWVATDGSDNNDGSQNRPFKTVKKAYSVASSGKVIGVKPGTYKEGTIQCTKADITIKSSDNANPAKFDGSSVQSGYGMTQGAQFNLTGGKTHLLNLDISKTPDFGVGVYGGDGNILERLKVHHVGSNTTYEGKGIFLSGNCTNTVLKNNDSYLNANGSGGGADGMQIATTGPGTKLTGNRAWGNSDDGFDFFMIQDNKNAAPCTLEDNWAFDNGLHPGTRNKWGDGAGFKLGGTRSGTSGKSGGHNLKRCFAWGNAVYGMSSNGNQVPVTCTDCATAKTGNAADTTRYGWYDMGTNRSKNTNCKTYGPLQEQLQPDPCPGVTRDMSRSWNATGADGPRGPNGELPNIKFV